MDIRIPYKDIKEKKISLDVLNVGKIPLKHPSSYEVGSYEVGSYSYEVG